MSRVNETIFTPGMTARKHDGMVERIDKQKKKLDFSSISGHSLRSTGSNVTGLLRLVQECRPDEGGSDAGEDSGKGELAPQTLFMFRSPGWRDFGGQRNADKSLK